MGEEDDPCRALFIALARHWWPTDVTETLIQITAPHFVAGIVARDGKVIEAANIVKYMRGWDGKQVADYCKEKGWSWRRVVVQTWEPT